MPKNGEDAKIGAQEAPIDNIKIVKKLYEIKPIIKKLKAGNLPDAIDIISAVLSFLENEIPNIPANNYKPLDSCLTKLETANIENADGPFIKELIEELLKIESLPINLKTKLRNLIETPKKEKTFKDFDTLKDLINYTVIGNNKLASLIGKEASEDEMTELYNKIFDELLKLVSKYEWFAQGVQSKVPEEDFEAVQKLVNSVVANAIREMNDKKKI